MLLPLLLTAIVVLLTTLASLSVKRIPEGEVYVLRRPGNVRRILAAGTHVVVPVLDRVVHKISLGGHALALRESLAIEGVEAPSQVEGLVYWQVLEPERADGVIDQAEDLIRRNTLAALRETGDPRSEAVAARNARLKHALNQHLRPRGVLVTRVELELAA